MFIKYENYFVEKHYFVFECDVSETDYKDWISSQVLYKTTPLEKELQMGMN